MTGTGSVRALGEGKGEDGSDGSGKMIGASAKAESTVGVLYSYGDKENAPANFEFEKRRQIERERILAEGKGRRAGAGAFGRLLSEVKEDKKYELEEADEKVALEQQVTEALALAREWLSEDADCKIASDLQATFEKEEKLSKQLQVSRGEAEALNLAIEERRRVTLEREARLQREASDAALVRKSVQEEEDLALLVAQDDAFAKRYHESLQDEFVAEELARKEQEAATRERERLERIAECDAKHAAEELMREMEDERARAEAQISADSVLARTAQEEIDSCSAKAQREQEDRDAALARKFAVQTAREQHRRMKKSELAPSAAETLTSISAMQRQWEDCEAQVEDVMDGICVTLLLPFVRDLKTKAASNNRVELEAYRIVGAAEEKTGTATVDNTQYAAEFIIEGTKLAIQTRDISYEYSSDTGLLHIYIEKVRLDGAPVREDEASRKSVLGSIKNSFKRFFGSGSRK